MRFGPITYVRSLFGDLAIVVIISLQWLAMIRTHGNTISAICISRHFHSHFDNTSSVLQTTK